MRAYSVTVRRTLIGFCDGQEYLDDDDGDDDDVTVGTSSLARPGS